MVFPTVLCPLTVNCEIILPFSSLPPYSASSSLIVKNYLNRKWTDSLGPPPGYDRVINDTCSLYV